MIRRDPDASLAGAAVTTESLAEAAPGPRRRWGRVGGWVLGVAVFAWVVAPAPMVSGESPELARWARQLRARDSLFQRTLGPWVVRHLPGLAAGLPAWFGPPGAAHRRIEACHRLIALGTTASSVTDLVAEAFGDAEPDVKAYAFLVLAHIQPDPVKSVRSVRKQTPDFPRFVSHLAGLLEDEDETVRNYAWGCLEACGSSARTAEGALRNLAGQDWDRRLAERARGLLGRWAAESGGLAPENDDCVR